jgi:hypothetical protein
MAGAAMSAAKGGRQKGAGKVLPPHFARFQALADEWALPTENDRRNKRMHSTQEELRRFYDAAQPVLDEWIQYLNGFELDAMPEPERNLLYLALSVVEVSPAIELFDNPWPKDVYPWHKFQVSY